MEAIKSVTTIRAEETTVSGRLLQIKRNEIQTGSHVLIVTKADQLSGKLTEGYVNKILTNSSQHPHGIKVRLETGEIGRVKKVLEF